ncbi:hypothetical protein FRC04_003072 [Tulasnella sp. 424]|nr:hypothetical protein FRC04_003072 [Tulasnella sp. 424]KAG8981137.1 hypothetical protein FRC05_004037 [Tulasnella sp. 425]
MRRTTRVPISADPASSPSTSTSVPSIQDSNETLKRALLAVAKAKRVVVVCGAGISVGAGIPDFRSPDGIFQTLKRENPKLSSGKDLFNASVFKSTATTSQFNTMIGNLAQQASTSEPTPFHRLLKSLDERGKLIRVYTQNIDCLEEDAGLTYGIPAWNERRTRSPVKERVKAKASPSPGNAGLLTPPVSHSLSRSPSVMPASAVASPAMLDSDVSTPPSGSEPSTSRGAASTPVAPRCIPLHGHVKTMYCPRCSHTTPLAPFVQRLSAGETIVCASCEDLESTRRLVGKRERGVGNLRPSVVLYGEVHREGEIVGECVRRDLLGIQGPSWISNADDSSRKGKAKEPASSSKSRRKPDLLIVAGTSLKVPGTKSIVRQFAKAIRDANEPSESSSTSPIHTIFINLEFPVPAREWESVFDLWLQGDVQTFAQSVADVLEQRDQIAKVRADQRAVQAARKLERNLSAPSTPQPSGPHSRPATPKKRKGKADDTTPDVTPVRKKLKPPPQVDVAVPPHSLSAKTQVSIGHPYSQNVATPDRPPSSSLSELSDDADEPNIPPPKASSLSKMDINSIVNRTPPSLAPFSSFSVEIPPYSRLRASDTPGPQNMASPYVECSSNS